MSDPSAIENQATPVPTESADPPNQPVAPPARPRSRTRPRTPRKGGALAAPPATDEKPTPEETPPEPVRVEPRVESIPEPELATSATAETAPPQPVAEAPAEAFTETASPQPVAEAPAEAFTETASGDPAFRLAALATFARNYPCDEGHTTQVLRLALRLFEDLAPLHGLGARERFLLHCAVLVHDIGWLEGRKGHHKRALTYLLDAADLPFEVDERLLIGNIARYHRRALPDARRHAHFSALGVKDRKVVSRVAAILRLADGLDASHQRLVEDLQCRVSRKKVVITCRIRGTSREDQSSFHTKSDLFEAVFRRRLLLEWVEPASDSP